MRGEEVVSTGGQNCSPGNIFLHVNDVLRKCDAGHKTGIIREKQNIIFSVGTEDNHKLKVESRK